MEKIRINTHGGKMPERHGDWYDLSTVQEETLWAGELKMISLGVSMELPKGTYAMVVPRSSTFSRYGIILANSVGIIDNEYNGDGDVWRFPALPTVDTYIPAGTRIAQFTIFNSTDVEFEEVESLGNEDRGGFGSTGK